MHAQPVTTTPIRILLTAAFGLALGAGLAMVSPAGAAHGNPAIAVAADPRPSDHRMEFDLGLLLGGGDIGDTRRQTWGLHVNAGYRFGDLIILGEANYLTVGKSSSMSQGRLGRAGIVARYSLLRTDSQLDSRGRRKPLSGDYWIEAGTGMQHLAWDQGGTVTRPDLVVGFGWQLNGVIGRKSPRPRYYGPYLAFRANLSRAPRTSTGGPEMCGGPCDTATAPPDTDVSMFLHLGLNWGR
ncbi:MAG: hypothetical protein AAGC55_17530 [Myxococcota bacterium]